MMVSLIIIVLLLLFDGSNGQTGRKTTARGKELPPEDVTYTDTGPTVSPEQFYGTCRDLVRDFDGDAHDSQLFCQCVRSGNHVGSFDNASDHVIMELHNFLPLTNREQYPFGEQLKWSSYLSLFLVNAFADSDVRLHTHVYDANCTLGRATEAIATIFEENSGAGIIAPTCRDSGLLVASFGQYMGMATVGYSLESSELEDRSTYASFYRLAPVNSIYLQGLVLAMRAFNWTKVTIIVAGGGAYQEGIDLLHQYSGPSTYSVSQLISVTTGQFDVDAVWSKVRKARARIVTVLSHRVIAEWTLCSAYHAGINTNCTEKEQYVFILPSWLPRDWFRKNVTMPGGKNTTLHCTVEQMVKMVAYSLDLHRQFYRRNETEKVSLTSNIAMSVQRWKKLNNHMADFCYHNGTPSSPKELPSESDAALLDSVLMFYNGFKKLNETMATAANPVPVGVSPNKEVYDKLDTRFNSIVGEGLRGLRWLFVYLVGKLKFEGLSGTVQFQPDPSQDFMTQDLRGEFAFWGLVNRSFPRIARNFTGTRPTRVSSAIYTQRNASGVAIPFGRFSQMAGITELNLNEMSWPAGCSVPNDTLPSNLQATAVKTVCHRIPNGLSDRLGCAGSIGFIVTLSAIGVLLLIVVFMTVVVKKWYKHKLVKALAGQTKCDNTFIVPELIGSKWEIPRDNVSINRKLGEGAFGAVYGGDIMDEEDESKCIAVAVKTLHDGSTSSEKKEFLAEGKLMTRFDHSNIVKLIGFCTKEEPFYVVMELMMHGDLRAYLLAHRHLCGTGDPSELNSTRLTSMVCQVASGLEYLAAIDFVHRDIAARNCMVTVNYTVKIGDFGMARRMYLSDYYRVKGEAPLPVRWMARESLFDGRFTVKSDMWSFGVVIWEVVTFGALPFPGMSNTDVIDHVREYGKLPIPDECPAKLRNFILSCWTDDPIVRLAASDAVHILEKDSAVVVACISRKRPSVRWKRIQHALSFNKPRGQNMYSERAGSPLEVVLPDSYVVDNPELSGTELRRLEGTTLTPSGKVNPAFLDEEQEPDGYMNTDLS